MTQTHQPIVTVAPEGVVSIFSAQPAQKDTPTVAAPVAGIKFDQASVTPLAQAQLAQLQKAGLVDHAVGQAANDTLNQHLPTQQFAESPKQHAQAAHAPAHAHLQTHHEGQPVVGSFTAQHAVNQATQLQTGTGGPAR